MYTPSKEFYPFLTRLEGSSSYPYQDAAGFWTIGVGHKLTKEELSSGVLSTGSAWRSGLLDVQIQALLEKDVDSRAISLNQWISRRLWQHEFDALLSFVFNFGLNAFLSSTLYRKLGEGLYEDVPEQMKRWVFSTGVKVPGLIKRREKESNLWSYGIYE